MKKFIGIVLLTLCFWSVRANEPVDSIRLNFSKSRHIHNFFVMWDYKYNYDIKKRSNVEFAGFYGYEKFIIDFLSVRTHTSYNYQENQWVKSHRAELGLALNYYIPLAKKLFLGFGAAYSVDLFRNFDNSKDEWLNSNSSSVLGIVSLDYFINPSVSLGFFNSNELSYKDKTYRNRTWFGVRYFIPPNKRNLKK